MHWQLVMEQYRYLGIILTLFAHFIPTELILAYAGYLVSIHVVSFLPMILIANVAFVASQSILYAIAFWGGPPIRSRLARTFPNFFNRLTQLEIRFHQHGIYYMLLPPLWKTLFGLLAGFLRIRFWTFAWLTSVSFLIWSLLFMWSGLLLGERWSLIAHFAIRHATWFILAIALLVWGFRRVLHQRKR
ncbi:DedA family protein [Exiguobacterium sp. BMC-KP]|uniref:DedA family protein n=1 Tax=Exiguobacterium sp. BMC-KP TaxID=1684312 RepID=UPI0006AA52DE|nr:VTT domain-containing protein [Exiguobacterium sp. BMC-KP]